jgi:hypothetical protein
MFDLGFWDLEAMAAYGNGHDAIGTNENAFMIWQLDCVKDGSVLYTTTHCFVVLAGGSQRNPVYILILPQPPRF